MAYPRGHLLLLPAFLCLMPLHASALSFDYNFSILGDLTDLGRQNLKCMNDCSPAGDRINLTKLTTWSTGRLAHLQPVRLWDDRTGKRASFTTSFSFFIGDNNSPDRGDGMAFFIGPFPPSLPSDSKGSFLGLFNNPNYSKSLPQTVGVEFDTHGNYDSVFSDPANAIDHIGIDVNNITSKNATTLPSPGLSGTMSANITYDADSTIMVVTVQLADGHIYPVETLVDLRAAGVPQDAAVGFSAATGAQIESHQLLSWSFKSTEKCVATKCKLWVVLVSVAAVVLVGLVAALLYVMRRRQSRHPTKADPSHIDLPVARKFSYNELSAATGDFSEDRKLGAGNFGVVYRGYLQDPRMTQVAVKKLTGQLEQIWKDYVTEITTLGELRHLNLVKLVGWCNDEGKQLLLVYELVTNRSVDEHLHGSERLLTWSERYRIVLGIGSAIEYLHTGYVKTILHRDIKPSNVMLDDAFEAKLGDFGLVRQVCPGQGSLGNTQMIGSLGYIDPICMNTDTVSTASDMYSFGVLLLEIATGKKPALLGEQGNTLVNAVRESYGKGAVLEMADERLNGEFDRRQMERVMVVGLLCVRQDRRDRPAIRDALYMLSILDHQVPEIPV